MNPFDVLLFAAARDIAGAATIPVELLPGSRVADLAAALARQIPALSGLLPRSRIAVNHEFADAERVLSPGDGDEIAVIPPVSGG